MKPLLNQFTWLTLLILLGYLMIIPASSSEIIVTRDIQQGKEDSDNVMDVTLTLNGLEKGGIIETLPTGVTFQSTAFPQEMFSKSGNNLIFAIINDTPVHYKIQVSDESIPKIIGKWEDIQDGVKGEVRDGILSSFQGQTNKSDKPARSSGISICIVLIALSLLLMIRRGNKE
ncbi:MAG: hypothetical protein LUQ50_11380 [Methanospirillum sp.]|uniref:hypothetical protein n=1 Tax=Methanospirillum sp. TaxID=45200 RepID=UPI002371645B|nr:hypothetical protein [Methanospirillum sp.]MDD1729656.1 hypothetical protein [Methanospirillum sp.]